VADCRLRDPNASNLEADMELLACMLVVGVDATALLDAWGLARRHAFGTPYPDYGLVGRWIGHLARGRFRHESIRTATPVRGELVIGWTAHYLIGIAFATVLLGTWGLEWVREPAIGPALLVGIGSVAAPFLVMQPGMGAGVAARRAPNPGAARLQSLASHTVFGFGLYVAGWVARALLVS